MKKTSKPYRWLLAAFAVITAMGLAGCLAEDDGEDASGFEQIPSTGSTLVKDVNTNDLDVFAEYALKMENLRLQYIKFTSNGWNGELFCGVGDKSDATGFINYLTDILENADRYTAAMQRLDRSGILTPTTGGTRGFLGDLSDAVFGLGRAAKERREVVIQRLNDMRVMGNAKAQRDLFEELGPSLQKGETSAREWFKNLYNGEYDNQIHKIDRQWQLLPTNDATQDYHNLANKNSSGLEANKSVHKTIAQVTESAGKVYYGAIDMAVGGYGSKMVDGAEKMRETYELGKKAATGNLTGKDIKKYVVKRANDHLKDAIGDELGEELTDQVLTLVAEEVADHVTEKALEEDGNEKKAKDAGLSLLHIEGTQDMGTGRKTAVVVDDKTGKVIIAEPDGNGELKMAMKPGKKTVTVVTDDGQRSTQKVEAKPGKVEVEAVPAPAEATLALSAETVTVGADGGTARVDAVTNCRYIRSSKKSGDWFTVSREGTRFTVSAEKNASGEAREGSFVIDVSTDGKKASLSRKVTVRQEAAQGSVTISVSESSIEFEAEGGSKAVTVNTGSYKYYGAFPAEEDEGWISIEYDASTTSVIVKAAPNPNSQERTGTVYVFASNNPNPQTLDEIEYVAIKVTQKVGGSTEFESIEITPDCYVIRAVSGEREKLSQDYFDVIQGKRFAVNKISVTKNTAARTWHIEGTSTYDYTYKNESYHSDGRLFTEQTISFDIENVSEGFKNSVITNLNAKYRKNWDSHEKDDSDSEVNSVCIASNIPYSDSGRRHIIFKGQVSSGLKFSNFESVIKWTGTSYHPAGTDKYTYSHDPTNAIEITLYLAESKARTPAARASGIPSLQRASVKAIQPK